MSIPKQIQPIHIAKAIKDLKKEGYDPKRGSTIYCLYVEGIALEMKRVISQASFHAIGKKLQPNEFDASEAKKFLEKLGFKANLGATK